MSVFKVKSPDIIQPSGASSSSLTVLTSAAPGKVGDETTYFMYWEINNKTIFMDVAAIIWKDIEHWPAVNIQYYTRQAFWVISMATKSNLTMIDMILTIISITVKLDFDDFQHQLQTSTSRDSVCSASTFRHSCVLSLVINYASKKSRRYFSQKYVFILLSLLFVSYSYYFFPFFIFFICTHFLFPSPCL